MPTLSDSAPGLAAVPGAFTAPSDGPLEEAPEAAATDAGPRGARFPLPRVLRERLAGWGLYAILPCALAAGWVLSTSVFHWFNDSQLPPPAEVWTALRDLLRDGVLVQDLSISVRRALEGFLIGSGAGVALGALVGLWRPGERLLDPTLQAVRTVPSFAWVPFLLLWMGIDEAPKVTLIAIGTFFPVYLNLVSGIRSVDARLIEVGRVLCLGPWRMLRGIILPAAWPALVTGLRLGLGNSWLFLTAAELIASTRGLGYMLTDGQNSGRVDLMLVSILSLAALGLLTDSLMRLAERPSRRRRSKAGPGARPRGRSGPEAAQP